MILQAWLTLPSGLASSNSQLSRRSLSALAASRRPLQGSPRNGLAPAGDAGLQSDGWTTVPVSERLGAEVAAKQKIAVLMAREISGGMTVFVDSASTAWALATELVSGPSVTVVTAMPELARIVDRSERHRVFLAGGELIGATGTVRGPETLQSIGARRYDLTVIGVTAINTRDGVVGSTEWHGVFVDLLRRCSDQLAVIADATRFGLTDRFRACPFAKVDMLISNAMPPNDIIKEVPDA